MWKQIIISLCIKTNKCLKATLFGKWTETFLTAELYDETLVPIFPLISTDS